MVKEGKGTLAGIITKLGDNMQDRGLIFDLENIIIFYEPDLEKENQVIYSFLCQRKYIFDSQDLQGLSPREFVKGIKSWRGRDKEILDNEIGVFQRQSFMAARVNPEAAGVFQALSGKYAITLISRSWGDGIVKVLAKAGVRSYVNYIVPGESWDREDPGTAVDLILERFPQIEPENWSYVGESDHKLAAAARGIDFLAYGCAALLSLDDVMDELM